MKKKIEIEENELIEMMEEHFKCTCSVDIIEQDEVMDVILLTYETDEPLKILTIISEQLCISSSDIVIQSNIDGVTTYTIDFIDLKTLLEEIYDVLLTGEYSVLHSDTIQNTTIEFIIK